MIEYKHSHNFIDLTGLRVGRLTVIEPVERTKDIDWKWRCICDCGNETIVRGKSLKVATTKSCGCLHDESARNVGRIHGESHTRLNTIWKEMRARCDNPNHSAYKYYGARGIFVCTEWYEYIVFREWALTHGYADNLSIDRIDVNGNYCPENCRWATIIEQANNKRNNSYIEYDGQIYTISQLARKYGFKAQTLSRRIQRGWTIEEAVSIPARIGNNQALRQKSINPGGNNNDDNKDCIYKIPR